MKKYLFKGPFAEHIKNHIQLKQAVGYKYEAEAKHLLRFSSFTVEKYPEASILSKEIVLNWCSKKSYEAQGNQCTRSSILRQLAIYMESVGVSAYILPKGYYSAAQQYAPHIYTEDELQRFFHQTDQCFYVGECPFRHLIMPVFFRIIYACGLRSSEARLLKVENVDMDSGLLSIYHSKKDNSRLVAMSDELTDRCRNYSENVHRLSKGSDWFFPGLNGKPMTVVNTYHNFRRFLWRAGISHGGRGKGPRVQDFRHTYACHCLRKWVLEGKDIGSYFPVLKTYMGHYSECNHENSWTTFHDKLWRLNKTFYQIKLEKLFAMHYSKFASDIFQVLQGLHDGSNPAFQPEFFVILPPLRNLCEKEPGHKKNQWQNHQPFRNGIGKYYFYDTLPPGVEGKSLSL